MRSFSMQALPSFNKANLLVVGDVMLDRYWVGHTSRVSPEAPVPIVHVQTSDERPGGAANVALNIRALGANVTLLGVIGHDEAGAKLLHALQQAGVEADLYQSNQLDTIVKLRVLSKHQQLLRMDFEKPYLDADIEAELLKRFKRALPSVQLVILSDYLKGTLRRPDVFIEAARVAGVEVLVDPKSSDVALYRGATWLTPNMKEFEAMVGDVHDDNELIEKARALLNQHHIHALLVTRGEAGMTLVERDHVAHLPAMSHEIYDVTGAGDTVISTLGAALAAGVASQEAMHLANIAAGIAVTKLGAVAVSLQELTAACVGDACYPCGIMTETALLDIVQHVRAAGKKIVFTNGCYDLLHVGHVQSLEMAKALGDYLIVAVNTDESIRQLKGSARPIVGLADRMAMLQSLRAVDWVIPFAESTPRRLLTLLSPDVLAKGGDYTIDEVEGADIVRAYGGEVHVLQHGVTLSTTAIVKRIAASAQEEQPVLEPVVSLQE